MAFGRWVTFGRWIDFERWIEFGRWIEFEHYHKLLREMIGGREGRLRVYTEPVFDHLCALICIYTC